MSINSSVSACNVDIVGAIGGNCLSDGTVLYRIIVNYQNAPGPLDINGTIFPVPAGSSEVQKHLYLPMQGDGETYDIIAKFVDEPTCRDIAYNLITTTCCIPQNTACNDGNALTINDKYDANCNCKGTCSVTGTACNDGKANTYNDIYNAECKCVGTPCPTVGTTCNDNNPATFNDKQDGFCNCKGTPCPTVGTTCNDNNPATFNDKQDGFCNCVGTPCPTAGTTCNCVGTPCPTAGTTCNDNNPATFNDKQDGFCNCIGTPCAAAGTTCNDNNPETSNDQQDGFCNCVGTSIVASGDFTVSVRMFLEGYMIGTKMHNDLEINNLISNTQPYSTGSLLYAGNEAITATIPVNIVDWVLVALLDANGNTVARKAAVLTENGLVYNADTPTIQLSFTNVPSANSYHVAVFHRSHLAAVSNPIANNGYADFSINGTTLGNVPTVSVNGMQTLYGGDMNQDGLVNNLDNNIWQQNNAVVMSYEEQDIDGNGIVNNLDYNFWNKNKSKVGHAFIRL